MTNTTSTVVRLRAALVEALLAARTGTTAGLQVSRRWPGPETEAEGIYLGAAAGQTGIASLVANGARAPRNETYQLEVIIRAWNESETPYDADAAEDRLWEIFALLENVLADGPKTGGVQWAEVASFEDSVEPYGPGWRGLLTVVLSATARLT